MLEQRVAAALRRRRDEAVGIGPERHPIRAGDAVAQQQLDRTSDERRVAVGVAAERPTIEGYLGDARDDGVVAVEDGGAFGDRDLMRGAIERLEVDVVRAAVGVAQLVARQREVGAQFDQRQDAALQGGHAVGGAGAQRLGPAEIGRRVLPAQRSREVDELARRERRCEPVAGLLVEQVPARLGDRRQRAKQMVHDGAPLRLPIPSDPSSRSGVGGSSRKSAVGTKNRLPVTAVEKSSIRS